MTRLSISTGVFPTTNPVVFLMLRYVTCKINTEKVFHTDLLLKAAFMETQIVCFVRSMNTFICIKVNGSQTV